MYFVESLLATGILFFPPFATIAKRNFNPVAPRQIVGRTVYDNLSLSFPFELVGVTSLDRHD